MNTQHHPEDLAHPSAEETLTGLSGLGDALRANIPKKKFTVTVARDVRQYLDVEVEATSLSEAAGMVTGGQISSAAYSNEDLENDAANGDELDSSKLDWSILNGASKSIDDNPPNTNYAFIGVSECDQ